MIFRLKRVCINRCIYTVIFYFAISTVGYAQNTGSWTIASTNGFSPRYDLSCSMTNGKIYAIGGYNAADTSAPYKIESFDPVTNSWTIPTVLGQIPYLRYLSTTVVNDKIYITEGLKPASVDVLDAQTNTIVSLTTTGSSTRRFWNTSATVNGKIYLIGGDSGSLKLVGPIDVFDLQTNTWSTAITTGNFTSRTHLCSAAINGKIYVLGGEDESGYQLNTLEVFDPGTNSWSTPVTTGNFGAKSTATGLGCGVIDGKIYVTGSSTTVEVFDPITSIWSNVSPSGLFTNRFAYGSVVTNGKLYLLGGGKPKIGAVNTNEVFTPTTSTVENTQVIRSNIVLYPNPTSGIITIQNASSGDINITVLNILGEKVMQLNNIHNQDITLDLSKLVRGTYYIRFISANSVVTKTVVRQ